MKYIVRIFKPIARWVTKTRLWQWGKTPQARLMGKVASAGITVYSLGSAFFPSKTDSAAHNEAAAGFLLSNFFTPNISQALAQQLNDVEAICDAAALIGASHIDEVHDGVSLRAFSYLCLSKYLSDCPDGTLLEADEIKKVITEDFNGFLAFAGVSEEEGRVGDIIEDELDDIDFDDMPIELLRHYDFLAFIINEAATLAMDSSGSVASDIVDSPRTTARKAPASRSGAAKMGLS